MQDLHIKLGVRLVLLSLLFINSCSCQINNDSLQNEQASATPDQLIKEESQLGDYLVGIFEDSKRNLWFSTLSKGMAKFDGNELQFYTTKDGLSQNRVGSLVEDVNGNIWFGTHAGISKFDGKTFTNLSVQDGLCDNRVSNLLIDQKGMLWIGTWGGVCKFDGSSFTTFPIPNPEIEPPPYQETMNWITEITEDSKGNIWFARDGYGASKYDGSSFTHYTKRDGLASNNVQSIQEDANGNIWFASRVTEKDHPDVDQRNGAGGVVKYDGQKFVNYPQVEGLYNSDVYALYMDSKNNIWISSISNGVYKFDGKEFTNYKVAYSDDEPSKAVVSIFEDARDNIWIGCAGGLFRLDEHGMVNVTTNGPWK